ncbi:MAG: alpha/beta hydrolase [Burkholderiaceae bacterium]|nr:alpha/beta hydrolase [Burkholderiaceae bacterium]
MTGAASSATRPRCAGRRATKAAIVGYQLWLAAAWRIGGAAGDRMARAMARRAHAPADPTSVHAQMGYPYAVQWTGAAGGYGKLRRFTPHCPQLFIYGERKPFMFHSRAWADEVAARPGSQVLGFDCGHWVMVQRRERFNAAVIDWLAATSAG